MTFEGPSLGVYLKTGKVGDRITSPACGHVWVVVDLQEPMHLDQVM